MIIEHNGAKTLVEIAVTHFVGKEKLNKIRSYNISTIEIDLSSLKNQKIDFVNLETVLTDSSMYKHWLYYKNEVELFRKRELELEELERNRENSGLNSINNEQKQTPEATVKSENKVDLKKSFFSLKKLNQKSSQNEFEQFEIHLDKLKKKIHTIRYDKNYIVIHNCPSKKRSKYISSNSDPFYFAYLETDCKSCIFFGGKDSTMNSIYCHFTEAN